MTETPHLGLPFIDGAQAQKHVTHNEALRILDAVIQVAVLDTSRTAPPASPVDGARHIVAVGPSGAWAGHAKAIATWEDNAWRFIVPQAGWLAWSVADDVAFVFDGAVWRDQRNLSASPDRLGVYTTADSSNRLSVRSNAVLFKNIATGEGGTGDIRLQMSKQATGNTASVVFANNFSGRAEFGLVGSDAFRLKVSPDGSSFADALSIDQATGNLTLPRGLAFTGTISPPQITANQNDYAPSGFASASVLRFSTDAPRNVTGLAGGADGRVVYLYNVGGSSAVLKAESASSSAANRFGFNADITIGGKQSVVLLYDAGALRWRQVGGSSEASAPAPQGRLTLTSGVPVLSTSVSGATTIYYTPCAGNCVPLYDGTKLVPTAFSELSQTTADTTKSPAAVAANSNYDFFIWNDAGTLRCTRGPAWPSNTSRGTGAGTTELARVNGLLLNANAITNGPAANRGTYVGTIRSNGSSQIDWIFGGSATAGFFGVWSAYNRVNVGSVAYESSSSWTYSSITARSVNGTTNSRHSFVSGIAEDAPSINITQRVGVGNAVNAYYVAAIGYDWTSGAGTKNTLYVNPVAGGTMQASASLTWTPGPVIGFHFFQQIENADGTNSVTAYGGTEQTFALQFRM